MIQWNRNVGSSHRLQRRRKSLAVACFQDISLSSDSYSKTSFPLPTTATGNYDRKAVESYANIHQTISRKHCFFSRINIKTSILFPDPSSGDARQASAHVSTCICGHPLIALFYGKPQKQQLFVRFFPRVVFPLERRRRRRSETGFPIIHFSPSR